MKLVLILFSFFFLNHFQALATIVPAQKTGVGLILGEPTGATLKYWKNKDRAIDAGLAFSFDDYMIFYSNYLIQFAPIKDFLPYAGIGGEILFSTYSRRDGPDYDHRNNHHFNRNERGRSALGIRIPIGVEWMIPNYPIGLFGEIAPGMAIIPDIFGYLQGGIGGRYYF